ncbi:400_t:CDS:2, partial [Acaulospora morrowiae]
WPWWLNYNIKQYAYTLFGSLFTDYDLGWDNNSNEDDPLPKYLPPTLGSGDYEVKPKNHRRTNIDLERSRKGLPARYKK